MQGWAIKFTGNSPPAVYAVTYLKYSHWKINNIVYINYTITDLKIIRHPKVTNNGY